MSSLEDLYELDKQSDYTVLVKYNLATFLDKNQVCIALIAPRLK